MNATRPSHPSATRDVDPLAGALLGIMASTGVDMLTLTEGLEAEEFAASRLTRQAVQQQLAAMAQAAAQVPSPLRSAMAEIDWPRWDALQSLLLAPPNSPSSSLTAEVWLATQDLVPTTVMWLRVFQHRQPALFSLRMDALSPPAVPPGADSP